VAIAAGDPVLLLYAAANRDPAEFGPDADRFDAGRHPNHHVAFGFGAHFCLGAALARAELAVVLEVLLDRFERLEPAGPVQRTGSSVINGIRHAPLRLNPR
jgi:cytochrome P450